MSPSATPLTAEILDDFREALKRQKAPLADELAAGLDDEEILALGFAPPPELETLLRWGTAPKSSKTTGARGIHPEFDLLAPHEMKEASGHARTFGKIPDNWVAFAHAGGPGWLFVACDADAVSPVTYNSEGDHLPAAPSLGALFTYWTEQITTGESKFVSGYWQAADDARPPWISTAA